MPAEQGENFGERRAVRLQPDLSEGVSRVTGVPTAREMGPEITRNVQGQSLDDAREEFQATWQVQLAWKERRLKRAWRAMDLLVRATGFILLGGTVFGALLGSVSGGSSGGMASLLIGAILGSMVGFTLALPLAFLVALFGWLAAGRASLVERSLSKLKRL